MAEDDDAGNGGDPSEGRGICRRAAGDDGDRSGQAGQPGQGGRRCRSGPRGRGIVDDGRERAVEVDGDERPARLRDQRGETVPAVSRLRHGKAAGGRLVLRPMRHGVTPAGPSASAGACCAAGAAW